MTDLNTILEKFGFTGFKPGQAETIQNILDHQSAIGVFPTGSGKSLCYQAPATYLPGLTLVVSPLLALIKDQLEFMVKNGLPAAKLDSTLTKEEEHDTMSSVLRQEIKILLISVERFKNERFRNFLKKVDISLMVVDEAHCISEWGHNFRPDYLKLPVFKEEFNINNTLLLTATATKKVRDDMAQKFKIPKENIHVTGFYRDNLDLIVLENKEDKLSQLLTLLDGTPTIVYVTLQKTANEVALYLVENNIDALSYHAGLKNEEREEIQNKFMNGDAKVVVATIAFGMGIDKKDIRKVIHYDLPKSIENYSQEIGRAGRDGKKSECTLIAGKENIHVLENFVYGDSPEKKNIQRLLSEINECDEKWEFQFYALSQLTDIRLLPLKTLLVYLEMEGIIKPSYSYFSEYRFSYVKSPQEIINTFKGERKEFVRHILLESKKARKWAKVDFSAIMKTYNTDRQRIIAALEYFDQKNYIVLESKGNTEVFEKVASNFDPSELSEKLYRMFLGKEKSDISRIHDMVRFFETEKCRAKLLSEYYGEETPWKKCGHCSICVQNKTIKFDHDKSLCPVNEHDIDSIISELENKTGEKQSDVYITRYLCGLHQPSFTKHKLKTMPSFGKLEDYNYQEVLDYVNDVLVSQE